MGWEVWTWPSASKGLGDLGMVTWAECWGLAGWDLVETGTEELCGELRLVSMVLLMSSSEEGWAAEGMLRVMVERALMGTVVVRSE